MPSGPRGRHATRSGSTEPDQSLALVALLAQDREQKRRRRALDRGQNSALHHAQTTTVPRRPWPVRERLAARPSGDIFDPVARRAAVAAAGSRAALN